MALEDRTGTTTEPEYFAINFTTLQVSFAPQTQAPDRPDTRVAQINGLLAKYQATTDRELLTTPDPLLTPSVNNAPESLEIEIEIRSDYIETFSKESIVASVQTLSQRTEQTRNPQYDQEMSETCLAMIKSGWLNINETKAMSQLTVSEEGGIIYDYEQLAVRKLKVGELEVGATENPTGITIYDQDTKKPFCIVIRSGEMKHLPGKCSDLTPGVKGSPTPGVGDSAPTHETANSQEQTANSPMTTSSHSEQSEESLPISPINPIDPISPIDEEPTPDPEPTEPAPEEPAPTPTPTPSHSE